MDDNKKEFPFPAPEYLPPEAEFPLPGEFPPPAAEPPAKRRRAWRPLPYAAAAILFLAMMGRSSGRRAAEEIGTFTDIESVAAVITEAVTATPEPVADDAPTAAPTFTAAPTSAPAATEAPTSAPTATPEPIPDDPEVDAVFVSFSDRAEGRIYFRYAQNVTSATAEIWDVNMSEPEQVIPIPAEAVAQGVYELPAVDIADVFFAHMDYYFAQGVDPQLELRLQVDYEVGGEARTITVIRRATDELGWYFTRTTTGRFTFGTYSDPERVEIVYDEPGQVAEGVISILVEINGVSVSADACEFRTREEDGYLPDGSRGTYYESVVTITGPDEQAGAGGTARITVTQHLRGYDTVLETVREIEW